MPITRVAALAVRVWAGTAIAVIALLGAGCAASNLHQAAGVGDVARVALEIKNGADVNSITSIDHWTPLMYAARGGNPEVINLLVDRGANIRAENSQGGTPLHIAAFYEKTENCRALLARGANVRARTRSKGVTPLLSAIVSEETSNLATIKLLLSAGAMIEPSYPILAKEPKKETAFLLLVLLQRGFPPPAASAAASYFEASGAPALLPPDWTGMGQFQFTPALLALSRSKTTELEQMFPGLAGAVFRLLQRLIDGLLIENFHTAGTLDGVGVGDALFNAGRKYTNAIEASCSEVAFLFRLIHLHASFILPTAAQPGSAEMVALDTEMAQWRQLRDELVKRVKR
jgi:hypothetical protein